MDVSVSDSAVKVVEISAPRVLPLSVDAPLPRVGKAWPFRPVHACAALTLLALGLLIGVGVGVGLRMRAAVSSPLPTGSSAILIGVLKGGVPLQDAASLPQLLPQLQVAIALGIDDFFSLNTTGLDMSAGSARRLAVVKAPDRKTSCRERVFPPV